MCEYFTVTRRVIGYVMLLAGLLALAGPAFLVLLWAAGLSVRVDEPPMLFVIGLLLPVALLWGARTQLQRQPLPR